MAGLAPKCTTCRGWYLSIIKSYEGPRDTFSTCSAMHASCAGRFLCINQCSHSSPADSCVRTKDPLRGIRRTTRRYLNDHHFVSYHYLHSYVILSVPPSLTGSHQGNLHKIHPGNTRSNLHTNLSSVIEVKAARASH